MKKLRIGIVGTGFAGKFHVECLQRIHGVQVEIAGITSLRPESRTAFGKQHNIPVFDDVPSMLDAIDILDICSPANVHAEQMITAAQHGIHIICEKPLAGYFGPPNADEFWRGNDADKEAMLDKVVENLQQITQTLTSAGVTFGYAENFVYAPSVQKEREIIEKTGAQILRMTGEESHNGSVSPVYGIWRYAGGGSLMGKGCHPLTGMLYLKRVEGLARNGRPIRPARVTARVHEITRLPDYQDKGLIRTDYHDIEDHGWMHVIFDDGAVADAITGEIVLGGITNYIEVFANNHRTRCNISPIGLIDTYNPVHEQYADIYLVEKTSTQAGWTHAAPDENYTLGYQGEMQDFCESVAANRQPQSDLQLALDTITTIYAAYLSDQKDGAEVPIPKL